MPNGCNLADTPRNIDCPFDRSGAKGEMIPHFETYSRAGLPRLGGFPNFRFFVYNALRGGERKKFKKRCRMGRIFYHIPHVQDVFSRMDPLLKNGRT